MLPAEVGEACFAPTSAMKYRRGLARCFFALADSDCQWYSTVHMCYFRLWYVQRAKPSARSLLRGFRGNAWQLSSVATAPSA